MTTRLRTRLSTERLEDRLTPAGVLDAAFGAGGIAKIDFFGVDNDAAAVAVQPDGKIVVVGSGSPNQDFLVARFNPDGTPDATFSGDGEANVSFGKTDIATAVALQPDGKIVVAGYTDAGGDNDFAVLRLNPDGTLDTAFSGDGKQTIDFGDDDQGAGVVIDGSNVVLAGSTGGATANFAAARLLPDGTLDATFGGDGKVNRTFGGADFATAVAVQGGKYVLAGRTDAAGSDQFAVLRLNPDGTPDITFSADGHQTIDFGPATERAAAVAIDGPNVVVVGTIFALGGGSSNFAIARLTSDGSLDATFSGDGKLAVAVGPDDVGTAVAVQNGKVVVGGFTDEVLNNDFVVIRLTATGVLDPTFSGDGKLVIGSLSDDQAFGLALQPDGQIVVAGTSETGGNADFAVRRVGGDTAGVSVTVTDGAASVSAGGAVTYTVVVSNAGPDAATGVQLADTFPGVLSGVSYTSVAVGGASGNTPAGAGNIGDALTLPAGSSVTYTVTATLSPSATGTLSNTATVAGPGGVLDPNAADNTATDTTAIIPLGGGSSGQPFAAGAGAGGAPVVNVYNPDGTSKSASPVFGGGFTGGVRVAAADLTGDGVPDQIVGTGPGAATAVRVLNGATGAVVFAVQPFEAAFTGGVYVAAGDITGDGVPDVVVTPDEGGGPRVVVYDGATFQVVANFFGIDDAAFRGGARAAVGDMNGDGRADLLVAAGFGGGPRVAFFEGTSVTGTPTKLTNDIFVFEEALRNGAFIAAGDVDGDGFADLISGGGPGGGPRVSILDGQDLIGSGSQAVLANFFAGNVHNRGGIRVAAKNLDGDSLADLVVGDGTGAGSRVTGYLGTGLSASPAPVFAFDAFPGFNGGVYVG
jgi:uncharacterized delta-60 repeat protein/uncharacterized repeat protein (TIGR01451 family)